MIEKSNCKLIRRLACIFYDSLLLFSLIFVGSFFALPFTGGEAISSDNLLYPFILMLATYYYFVWQWVRGGQTLGMRAWQCKLEEDTHTQVSWKHASIRFFLAIFSWLVFAAGFFMAVFRQDNKTFHDLYSRTVLVHKPHEK